MLEIPAVIAHLETIKIKRLSPWSPGGLSLQLVILASNGALNSCFSGTVKEKGAQKTLFMTFQWQVRVFQLCVIFFIQICKYLQMTPMNIPSFYHRLIINAILKRIFHLVSSYKKYSRVRGYKIPFVPWYFLFPCCC